MVSKLSGIVEFSLLSVSIRTEQFAVEQISESLDSLSSAKIEFILK